MKTKWVAKSLTVWGGVVAALPGIFVMLGWDVNIDGVEAAGVGIINGASVIIGLVMVVVGRFRANRGTPVTLKPQ